MKHYGDEIYIISGSTFTKNNIVLSASLLNDEAVKKLDIKGNDIKAKIRDVALILLEEINKAEKRQLPDNLKIEHIQKSEVEKNEGDQNRGKFRVNKIQFVYIIWFQVRSLVWQRRCMC